MRLEIEDVIFHDPGRDDQQRFGDNVIPGRPVLNKLHEVIAEYNFSRRRGHMGPDLESVADRQFLRCQQREDILGQILRATNEICAALAHGGFHNLGTDPWDIGWRGGIENLIDHEPDALGSFRVHAAHLAGSLVPPTFLSEMSLLPEHQRRLAPGLVLKAPVMPLRMKRRLRCRASQRLNNETGIQRCNLRSGNAQLRLPAGRTGEVQGPIEPCRRLRVWRQALGHARGGRPQDPIPVFE